MKNLGIIIVLFSVVFFQSCMTNTAFQTGKTVGKNRTEIVGGVSNSIPSSDSEFRKEINASTTQVHGLIRYGIQDNLDVEAGLSVGVLNYNFPLKTKYQFLGDQDSKFAGSVGIGASTDFITNFGVDIPTYFSYHPNNNISFYTSPRFRYGVSSVGDSSFNYQAYGLVTGIKLGNDVGFFVEHGYTLLAGNTDFLNFNQFNCGMSFNF